MSTSLSPYKEYAKQPTIGGYERGFIVLWIGVVAFLGVGDAVTTYYGVFHAGAGELNPFMDAVIAEYGAVGLFTVKAAAVGVLFPMGCFIYSDAPRLAYATAAILAIGGLAVTVNNIVQILTLVL